MEHQVIGVNPDGTVTVRIFVGDQIVDRNIPMPSVPTLESLIADQVKVMGKKLQTDVDGGKPVSNVQSDYKLVVNGDGEHSFVHKAEVAK